VHTGLCQECTTHEDLALRNQFPDAGHGGHHARA
jgi:hypothetical protein